MEEFLYSPWDWRCTLPGVKICNEIYNYTSFIVIIFLSFLKLKAVEEKGFFWIVFH